MNKEVPVGEIAVASGQDDLAAAGIGSCVVVALYDPKNKIAALAHTMLPTKEPAPLATDTRYIDIAITQMLKKMQELGAGKQNIEAKLIGGANMFFASEPSGTNNIGKQNIVSARENLRKNGIPIVGECVGGSQGRSVEFSTANGIVTVKTKF